MSDTNLSPHYPDLIQTLLAGKAICGYSHPPLYRLLSQGDAADQIDNADQDAARADRSPDRVTAEKTLATMGRRLTQIEGVYFAAFVETNATARAAIEQWFMAYQKKTPFLTEFFEILREARRSGDDLNVGDRFDFSDVLGNVMQNPGLSDRLVMAVDEIARLKNPSPEQALRRGIEDLVDDGYLVPASSRHQTYVVAGEKALFDDYRDLVMELEDVQVQPDPALDDEAPEPMNQPLF